MSDHRTLEWAVDIIRMCEPIRCNQGGMWFSRNHNFADATFVDYGAADAFAVAAATLPDLVTALKQARDFIDPDRSPPRITNRELVAKINGLLGVVGQPGESNG